MTVARWLLLVLTLFGNAVVGGETSPAPVRYGIDHDGFRVVVDLALPLLPAEQAARLEALAAATIPNFTQGMSIGTWVTTHHAQMLAEQVQLKAAFPAAASVTDWFEDTVITTTWSGGGVISLHCEQSSFTGGAHGNVVHAALIVDAATMRPLSLDEVIGRDDQTAFSALLSDAWRHANQLPPHASLREHNLSVDELPAKLPLITAAGIEVIYPPYEVGPYSIGTVRVTLTRDQARRFLRRDPWGK